MSSPEERLKWNLRQKMREAAREWYTKRGLEVPQELLDTPGPRK